MADKPLQSIKFPGLSDTYIVPQIDNTLTHSGQAADAKAVGDEISDLKSQIDASVAPPTLTWTVGKYIQDGAVNNSTHYAITDLIPMQTGDLIDNTQTPTKDSSNNSLNTYLHLYSGGVWQERVSLSSGTKKYTVQTGIDGVRFMFGGTNITASTSMIDDYFMANFYLKGLNYQAELAMSNEVTATKSALKYNSYDTLLGRNGASGTHNGVTFTWSGATSSVAISGKATGGSAFKNLFYNTGSFPTGVEAGGTYYLMLSGNTNSGMRIGFYNGSTAISAETYTSDAVITVPSNATGMYIRAQVEEGVTASDTVYYALLNVPSNANLAERMATIESKNLFESIKTLLPSGTNLTSVVGNCCYALAEANTYYDSPIISGFLFVYKAATLNLQVAVRYAVPSDIFIRRKLTSQETWSDWLKVAGSNTYNVTQTFNSYSNTYNVDATPTITTDTNNYLASSGDTTDRTSDIVTMLSTTGICMLGPGSFYVKNLVMPNNTSLIGSGRVTRVNLINSNDAEFTVKLGSYCTISDIWFYGQGSTITSESVLGDRHGILWQGTYTASQSAPSRSFISDVFISSYSGGAIKCTDTGTPIANHIEAVNVEVVNCGAGIYIPYSSEFHKFTNCSCNDCLYGCLNNGGNNMFVNCDFSGNKGVGFCIDNENGSAVNTAHGSAIGCLINHTNSNTGVGIKVVNVEHGYVFDGCQIFYSQIYLEDAEGISVVNSNFGYTNTAITIKNGGAILFANNMHGGKPTISITNNNNVHFVNCYNRSTGSAITPD